MKRIIFCALFICAAAASISGQTRQCIDYILALNNRARYQVRQTAVLTEFECADVTKVSDHLPVFVDVMIK